MWKWRQNQMMPCLCVPARSSSLSFQWWSIHFVRRARTFLNFYGKSFSREGNFEKALCAKKSVVVTSYKWCHESFSNLPNHLMWKLMIKTFSISFFVLAQPEPTEALLLRILRKGIKNLKRKRRLRFKAQNLSVASRPWGQISVCLYLFMEKFKSHKFSEDHDFNVIHSYGLTNDNEQWYALGTLTYVKW